MRIGGPSFRRAVAASLGLHLLIAMAIILAGREQPRNELKPRGIDTRVAVQVRFMPESMEVPVEAPEPVTHPEPASPLATPPVEPSEPIRDSRPPVVKRVNVPQSLPPELVALMRKPSADPVPPAKSNPSPGPFRKRRGKEESPPSLLRKEAGGLGSSPIHGALPAGQTIVYVLDASGSMGEWGKFDVARRSLLATLGVQPDSVKFQIVVYSGMAEFPVRIRGRMPVPATAANVQRAAAALQALGSPAGQSNHLAALRAALELEPDIILILTDAADWPSASLRAASRRAVVYIARVTADGVGSPVEAK
jgi:hypothetical protein